MKKVMYVYAAIFEKDVDGISISFPDLPGCLTCGDDMPEALKNAKEALELHIISLKEDCKKLPIPSPIYEIKLERDQFVTCIQTDMI